MCYMHAQYLKQSKMNTTVLEMTVNKFILASGETMLPRENPYMLLQSCNTMGQKNYITGMQQNTNSTQTESNAESWRGTKNNYRA